MTKVYKEAIIDVCTTLGITIPKHLTMDQKQIERLIVAIEAGIADIGAVGDAVAANVLFGKTFSSADAVGAVGSMPNRAAANVEVTSMAGTTIPAGYYVGTGKAVLTATEVAKVIPGNIKSGITLLGVVGTYTGA